MKAAVFYGPNQPLKVEEVPTPVIGAGEVLVKVAACGLCHTDIGYIDHGTPTFKKPPMILGHEVSGTVAEIAPDVTTFKIGDHVLLPAVMACGECGPCREGRGNTCDNMKMFGNDVDGGYAEYVKAPANNLFHLPDEIPLIEGAIIADAVTTPFHAIKNRSGLKAGDTLLVYGCGGVGLNLVQLANAVGVSVYAVDIVPMKLEKAMELGCVGVFNAKDYENDKALVKAVKKATGGAGVDVGIECIGNAQTLETTFNCVRNGGRLVIVGFPPAPMKLNAGKVMYREMDVVGSLGCSLQDYPKAIELIRSGKIKIVPMVTKRFSLDEINEGLDFLRSGQGIRSVVCP
jgi:6-hydroxycyclohex-1-ene-1-carbonyl-CoA dehydrogenase